MSLLKDQDTLLTFIRRMVAKLKNLKEKKPCPKTPLDKSPKK